MRLDARDGHTGFTTYDAKRCVLIRHARWVDTDSATWGELDVSPAGRVFASLYGEFPETTRQEERITVYIERKFIVFNEVDLGDDEGLDEAVSHDASHREKVGA